MNLFILVLFMMHFYHIQYCHYVLTNCKCVIPVLLLAFQNVCKDKFQFLMDCFNVLNGQ